jgi:hypothetical protein
VPIDLDALPHVEPGASWSARSVTRHGAGMRSRSTGGPAARTRPVQGDPAAEAVASVSTGEPGQSRELALFEGGPFARLLLSARLYGPTPRHRVVRRTLLLVAFTWLPLLVLSGLEGQAFGERSRMPFLLDASAHVRLLLALPLMVLAEIAFDARVRPALATFVQRGLVPTFEMPRFRAAIEHAQRRGDSWLAEGVMLLIVYGIAAWHIRSGHLRVDDPVLEITSWQALPASDGGGRSLAGLWFTFVSLPLFQFLILRWYYRILVWGTLMWRVSRLSLQLLPAHPDRAAGLGFLAQTVYAYVPLALGHGTIVSAAIVNRIFYGGASLTDFRVEMFSMVVLVFVLVLAPLLVFAPVLIALNLRATAQYGALADGVVRAFETRWIRGETRKPGELLELGEVSTMTDLDTTVAIVREMHYVPVTTESMIWIAVAVLAPLSPLVLTMMPVDELLRILLGLLV